MFPQDVIPEVELWGLEGIALCWPIAPLTDGNVLELCCQCNRLLPYVAIKYLECGQCD